jgi:hypothetical protein
MLVRTLACPTMCCSARRGTAIDRVGNEGMTELVWSYRAIQDPLTASWENLTAALLVLKPATESRQRAHAHPRRLSFTVRYTMAHAKWCSGSL